MKRDIEFVSAVPGYRSLWRSMPVLAASLAAVAIVALYWRTAASIVAIWIRSDTFAHGFIVVPICIWLVWRERAALALLAARPWWPGLALLLGAGALWFLAGVAHAQGAAQFALAFMVQAAILTVVGPRVTAAMAFPLAFLLFAVPAGEVLVPTLVDWTADFVVAALRATGVPVFREANHFVIPSGRWSVIDACSGIRYLIASVMVGAIYALITYRSLRYRALFIAASIAVPIVANWLRAYLIVMIGHLSNNRYAAGIDHFIYGWLFFGIVMLLLFWVGSFWREAPLEPPQPQTAWQIGAPAASDPAQSLRLFVAALAAIAAAAVWLPLAGAVERAERTGAPAIPPIAGAGGWSPSAAGIADWKPSYSGHAAELSQSFARDGREVGVHLVYYRNQKEGAELVTSGNSLTKMEDWRWKQRSAGEVDVDWMGRSTTVDRAEIMGPEIRFEVLRLYWIDGRVTSSELAAKALLAYSVLRGRGDDAAAIFIHARGEPPAGAAREALRAFVSAMSPSIERALDAARRGGT